MIKRSCHVGARLLLLVLASFSTGCIRHAYYPENVRSGPQPASDTPIRLFYDRQGNLYPDASVVVGGEGSIRPAAWYRWNDNHTLKSHFEYRPEAWARLAGHYLRTTDAFTDELWTAVQDSIRSRELRNIVARSRPGSPIVVLVHGFNVPEPEPGRRDAFDVARDSLTSWYGNRYPNMIFVEIRWDGLVGTGPGILSLPGGARVWTYAQANGYFVGMELRRVLAALPHDRPVRILTHSLGGHVATAALWNVSSKFPAGFVDSLMAAPEPPTAGNEPYMRYFHGFSAPEYRTPTHPDLRLAMIVPAMPGLTFGSRYPGGAQDYYDRNFAGRTPVQVGYRPPENGPPSPYDRIIIGQNSVDETIDKFIGRPAWYGSTTLGGQEREFSEGVAPILNGRPERNGGRDIVAYRVDIREARGDVKEREHDWGLYFQRENIRSLTDCLLTERCNGRGVTTH